MEAYEVIQGAKGPSGFGAAAVLVFFVQAPPKGSARTEDLPGNVSTAVHISGYNVGYRFHVVGTGVSSGPTVHSSEEAAKEAMSERARCIRFLGAVSGSTLLTDRLGRGYRPEKGMPEKAMLEALADGFRQRKVSNQTGFDW